MSKNLRTPYRATWRAFDRTTEEVVVRSEDRLDCRVAEIERKDTAGYGTRRTVVPLASLSNARSI